MTWRPKIMRLEFKNMRPHAVALLTIAGTTGKFRK